MNTKLKNIFKLFSFSQNKIKFLLENIVLIDFNIKKEIIGSKIGSGKYGQVFNHKTNSNKVIKILNSGFSLKTLLSIQELPLNNYKGKLSTIKCASSIIDSFIESYNLYKAEKSKITPKIYNFYIVKYKNKYYPAIEMQKIKGESLLEKFNYSKKDIYLNSDGTIELGTANNMIEYSHVVKTFKKLKLKHKDIHLGNILLNKKGQYKIIDFSSMFIAHKIHSKYRSFFIYSQKLYQLNYQEYHKLKIVYN
jgi:hypothetical protein